MNTTVVNLFVNQNRGYLEFGNLSPTHNKAGYIIFPTPKGAYQCVTSFLIPTQEAFRHPFFKKMTEPANDR